VLLVATALALVLTIDCALNAIWCVRQPRPFGKRVLVYWAALTLGPLALGMSLTLTSYAVSASRGLVSALPGGMALLLDTVQFALLAAATEGLFHYVPNTAVRWRHAWAGALFVAVAFELAKKALAWYVDSVPTYSTVYGALAALPILLLWIYLGWVILLLGAVIAAYAPSLQMRVVSHPATPGWRFEMALAEALRSDPLQLEPLVEMLGELDWVSRLDEADSARLVLLCGPAATPLLPLMQRTLLAPGVASTAFGVHAGLERLTFAQALGH